MEYETVEVPSIEGNTCEDSPITKHGYTVKVVRRVEP